MLQGLAKTLVPFLMKFSAPLLVIRMSQKFASCEPNTAAYFGFFGAFLHFLVAARPERHIAVVTHSSFLAALLNTAVDTAAVPEVAAWFDNAELREMHVAPCAAPDASGG